MLLYVTHIKQHRKYKCTLDFFALNPSCLKMQEYTIVSKLVLYYIIGMHNFTHLNKIRRQDLKHRLGEEFNSASTFAI